MTALALLILALALLVWSVLAMRIKRSIDANTAETRALRLSHRTKISTARVRTGADEDLHNEHQLREFARSTQAKRIVVGGDATSEQFLGLGGIPEDN